jgi:UDP-GlcNAc:undecaprenyl-phosphate GlcNAc-1-phosphate transferase
LVDDPGSRKIHDHPIPLAGGFAVMTGLLFPLFVASLVLFSSDGSHVPSTGAVESAPDGEPVFLLHYGLNRRALELLTILFGCLGMLLLGWLDDRHELRPRTKFAGQLFIAFLVAASGVRITLFVPNVFFSYVVTLLWIVSLVNAFNFMDNMNGLCGGLGAIGAGYFAVLAATQGQYLVALLAFLVMGSLLGFLPYNFPRATAFLGDAGSHLVGFLLAVLAILPHFHTARHPRPWAVLAPLLVLALPLGDLVWVVILRWRLGRPFYQGDTNHLSHRLVARGLSRTAAVLLIWAAAAGAGALVFLL